MTTDKKPLTLSIIIPVYNDARHLEACLESIKRQSVMPDEVIVVDNNCTDDSVKIAKKYDFVRVVREKKQGIVYARNRGFKTCKSDIIGRIDADTVLSKNWVNYLKKFYSKKKNLNSAWTGGGLFRNTRFPKFFGWLQSQVAYRFNRLLLGHYILWGSNMAILREHWQTVEDNLCIDNKIHEDLDLAIHLAEQGVGIRYEAYRKVSVMMRRIHDKKKLKANLMMWPATLKKHGKKTWIFGWLGAYYIYSFRRVAWIASPEKND